MTVKQDLINQWKKDGYTIDDHGTAVAVTNIYTNYKGTFKVTTVSFFTPDGHVDWDKKKISHSYFI